MGIYSKDLRIRAVAAVVRGLPRREILETFSISLTTLKRWLRMMSSEGKEDLSLGVCTGPGNASSRRSKRRRLLCGASSKRTTTPPPPPLWSVTVSCGTRGRLWRCVGRDMSRAIREKLG
jgi:transposase-like protein